MEAELKQMNKKLMKLTKDVELIKQHVVDEDAVLTPEEEKLLQQSRKHLKQGKTLSSEELKRELGI